MDEPGMPRRDDERDGCSSDTRAVPEGWCEALRRSDADLDAADLVESGEVMAVVDATSGRLAAQDKA